MPKMIAPPKITATVIAAFSVLCCLTLSIASAQPVHTPTKMPMAKAESVGMSTDGLSRIDELMQELIDSDRIQGAVTIVARRGKVVHFSTHGEMDVEKGRAMETDAIFRMASSSKPVLGVAAMMMIEEGLMKPSDPVSKYIPEFADMKVAVLAEPADRDVSPAWVKKDVPKHRLVRVNTPVTIHHLLTHTSGIRSGGLGAAVDPVERHTNDDTLATYIPRLAKVPLDFQPGTRWSYSPGAGLDVVARIIEIVSSMPFDEFLRKRIFNPLEMNSSHFNLPSENESKRVVVKGSAKGNWAKLKGWGPTKYYSASGGLSSAAKDYLHFEQMLLNGGKLFGHRLLSQESVKMMSSNQVGDLYSNMVGGKKGQKGMGFGYTVAVTLDPHAAANHRGKGAFGWGGAYGTMSWTDPENELVAVLMVQQPYKGTGGEFAKAVQQAIIE